jgi:hypothetical protein
MKASPEGHGLQEALLSASSRLPEGLKVLASDVEEHVEEAARNLSSGDLPRASSNLREARRIVGDLRAQSKKGSRREKQTVHAIACFGTRRLISCTHVGVGIFVWFLSHFACVHACLNVLQKSKQRVKKSVEHGSGDWTVWKEI